MALIYFVFIVCDIKELESEVDSKSERAARWIACVTGLRIHTLIFGDDKQIVGRGIQAQRLKTDVLQQLRLEVIAQRERSETEEAGVLNAEIHV